ncbi:MAG: hypothetical protein Q9219_003872 [cf. Caloplaca sp. 3 TL-2023]
MLSDVKLPFHPTTANCLAWSEDGDLAIAATEFIHLLIPRRNPKRDRQNATTPEAWVHVGFRINSYTSDQWSSQSLDDLDSFCIGEEQSPSTIAALSWSPLGLAKHKRSALAVLTTNHVLSLWASASDPKTASTWERVLVINKALEICRSSVTTQDETDLPNGEMRRKLVRVQSMSWALMHLEDGLSHRKDPQAVVHGKPAPTQLLAVTNDADEVIILQIRSPWLHQENTFWEALIASRATWEDVRQLCISSSNYESEKDSLPSLAASEPQWPSLFASSISEKTFIDHVVCIPCRKFQSGIGIILRKDRETLEVDISFESVLSGSAVDSWMPVFHSMQATYVNYFLTPEYSRATVLAKVVFPFNVFNFVENSQTAIQTLQLTNEWDEISGMAYTTNETHDVFLHVSGLIAGPSIFRIRPGLDPKDKTTFQITDPKESPLTSQIQSLHEDFDRNHNLNTSSIAKTWGLASWGPYMASCVSYHPGDMIEYTLTSGERCHIFFNLVDEAGIAVEDATFPWQDMGYPEYERDRREIHALLSGHVHDLELVAKAFERLATAAGLDFEPELNLLKAIQDSQLSTSLSVDYLNEVATSRVGQEDQGLWRDLYHSCSICDEVVVWMNTGEASCVAGHQFGMIVPQLQALKDTARCALTFLPVKEPGMSKYCESCGREFLDETFVVPKTSKHVKCDVQMAVGREGESQKPTGAHATLENSDPDHNTQVHCGAPNHRASGSRLTKALFAVFDVCPYCGGKYVG